MGFLSIMKQQENPDGREGHEERLQRFHLPNDALPPKTKFCGHGREPSEWMIEQAKKDRELKKAIRAQELKEEYERLSKRCVNAHPGCNEGNCRRCKKKVKRAINVNGD